MWTKISILLGCFLSLQLSAVGAQNGIHVAIAGLHSDKGQVICSLYCSADGFPKDGGKAMAYAKSPIINRHADCSFSGIQPGTYAVSVFHDENSNGRLDTNFLGIPREGVGASNNAKGRFGPPKFHDASVVYAGGDMDLRIEITYL
jgi:uncharacterized protein (DUF2141 family)